MNHYREQHAKYHDRYLILLSDPVRNEKELTVLSFKMQYCDHLAGRIELTEFKNRQHERRTRMAT